ncbi:MAG: Unknown protein [uncultured Aureispira sp.]|uniref:Alpha-2-macroglobulin domain-containing protein n=1 Tax=uncultured Aureispira sp. TaxID=1331704 RepID=A0A6S6UM84_9BACT|nr:MAG: Unknown protein [uncultured Aureispira sp.]
MKQLILCCLVCWCSQSLSAQILASIQEKYTNYDSIAVQEKVYVQTDRTLYEPNEEIWFTVFVTNAENAASIRSKQVYAALYSPNGAIVAKLTLKNSQGQIGGYFKLPADALGGIYKLRVYTYWMQNFEEGAYFEKEVRVQKVVFPEVLMQLDFEREAYGAGDQVVANFEAKTKENEALAHKKLTYTVQLDGQVLYTKTAKTDQAGKALLSYVLPQKLTSNNNLINVRFEEDGLLESIARSAPIVLNRLDLQLLPEGGTVIANQPNRMAIKVLNEFGQPADIEGEILNKAGKVMGDFKTFHQGMGAFEFVPKEKESYQVRVTKPTGIRQRWSIPAIEVNKLGIHLNAQTEKSLSFDVYSPTAQTIYVVAQQQGNLIYTQKIEAKKGANVLTFSTVDFPMGIVQVTLFDAQAQAHAERLVFVNAHRKLNVKITTNKERYAPREKVALDIWVQDETGQGVQGNFSMAVVEDKQHAFAADKQDNILSYLLMSSLLKGRVYEPDFYFDPENEKAAEALDYVLLTHGWRRFEWQAVLSESNLPEITYLLQDKEISGYLKIGEQLGKNQTIFLSEGQARYSKRNALAAVQTDENGFFKFEGAAVTFPAFLSTTYHGEYQSIRIDDYSEPVIGAEAMLPVIYQSQITKQGYYKKEADGKLYDQYNQQVDVLHGDIVGADGVMITDTKEFRITKGRIENKSGLIRIDKEGYAFSRQGLLSKKRVNARADKGGIPIGSTANNSQAIVLGNTSANQIGLNEVLSDEPVVALDKTDLQKKAIATRSERLQLSEKDINISTGSLYGIQNVTRIEQMNRGLNNRYNVSGSKEPPFIKTESLSLKQIAPENLQYEIIPKFYQPNYVKNKQPEIRSDFRKTIYWNPAIQTNHKGKAAVTYYNSDEVSTFRAILEGRSTTGQLAHQEHTYYTILPFDMITKIPSVLSFGDTVRMPVVLKNNSPRDLVGQLKVELPWFLNVLEMPLEAVHIAANSQEVFYVTYQVGFDVAEGQIQVRFKTKGFNDNVVHAVKTSPKGFPVNFAMSGQYLEQTDTFILEEMYEGSLKSELTFFPNVLEGLIEGGEGILSSPSGCFEQVSSSNYPNILAVQLMQQTGNIDARIQTTALGYLESGYKKLAAYEISGGGFEWYGQAPAHEGLTAYGLVQFKDMQAVYTGVESSIIERTQAYLLSRRDGRGGFEQNVGKYGFSGNKPALFNAYITWALSEVKTKGIQKEVEAMTKEAIASEDLYRMSLAALTHFNLGNEERAENLLKSIQDMIQKVGLEKVRAESTVTYSTGNALNIETLSFAALAMLESEQRKESLLIKIVEYLLSKRQYGRFGSTQSTVMALKVLTAYAGSVLKQQEDKLIKVLVNGEVVWKIDYKKEQQESLRIDSLHQYFVVGENIVTIAFDAATQGLPYSFDVAWTSPIPQRSAKCPLVLTTSFGTQEAEMGETVRLDIAVENTKKEGLPSSMALIGIPAGLSVQAWQLKDLQEKQKFSFYELKDNYLILYYRELDGQETKRLSLDLKTEVPGHYTAPANTTYLYYGEEHKYWSEGTNVQIN